MTERICLETLKKVLTPKEMKNVKAGSGGGGDGSYGTCGWSQSGESDSGTCGISKESAQSYHQMYGGWWCCDSCSTTSYCGWYSE